MSEYNRLKRVVRSLMPDFTTRRKDIKQYYDVDDARMMINELGMQIPPKILKGLLNSDAALDEFVNGVYLVEDEIKRKIVTNRSIIDPQYQPQVHLEENLIGFTITHKREEIIFAEFKLNYKKKED